MAVHPRFQAGVRMAAMQKHLAIMDVVMGGVLVTGSGRARCGGLVTEGRLETCRNTIGSNPTICLWSRPHWMERSIRLDKRCHDGKSLGKTQLYRRRSHIKYGYSCEAVHSAMLLFSKPGVVWICTAQTLAWYSPSAGFSYPDAIANTLRSAVEAGQYHCHLDTPYRCGKLALAVIQRPVLLGMSMRPDPG